MSPAGETSRNSCYAAVQDRSRMSCELFRRRGCPDPAASATLPRGLQWLAQHAALAGVDAQALLVEARNAGLVGDADQRRIRQPRIEELIEPGLGRLIQRRGRLVEEQP